jgi:hypothetical protein
LSRAIAASMCIVTLGWFRSGDKRNEN